MEELRLACSQKRSYRSYKLETCNQCS